jgi:UDP-N-acetylglucosamine--N-acetylmuramyl-(pentapeptide) pyrophosphoryl-undecaprenol N-acetylglucosamine transferase
VRGKGAKTKILAPFIIARAIYAALRIMRRVNPDIVIGMGGFVSGPGGVAAWMSGRPLFIHEQNAKAGWTNKLLAYLAVRVLAGFPHAFAANPKLRVVGNPVRFTLTQLPPPDERLVVTREQPMKLLVVGGSLGAQVFNALVPQALALLPQPTRCAVWHQTGANHYALAVKNYAAQGVEAKLEPFISDMAAAYAWADIVLCRAGALTVAEVCAVGIGAIFVPFPFAVDDHQTANAQFLVNKGAAICIQQKELTPSGLAQVLLGYSKAPEQRLKMAQAAYQLRTLEVSKRIFAIISEVVTTK